MDTFQQMPNENLLEAFIPKEAAYQLLAEHRSIYNVVMDTTEKELLSVKTLESSRIRRIQYLRELFLRLQNETRHRITVLRSPQDAAAYLAGMQHLQQEQFRVLVLNCKNEIIAKNSYPGDHKRQSRVPKGDFPHRNLQYGRQYHDCAQPPSGDPAPSKEDMDVTAELVKVGCIMKIPVQDHIIIGKKEKLLQRWNAFYDGLLPIPST